MKEEAIRLRKVIEELLPYLEKLSEKETSKAPVPGKWSAKEVLGHLIDSANNNQQKVIRMLADHHVDFVGYDQDHWVNCQHYNHRNWAQLLKLWQQVNLHFAHLIENIPPSKLSHTIKIDGKGPFDIAFIVPDYTEHLLHHLKGLIPEINIQSKFKNIYN